MGLNKKSALKNKTQIIPVDSEHFSISKSNQKSRPPNINKIYITASGGPFLNLKFNKLKRLNRKTL